MLHGQATSSRCFWHPWPDGWVRLRMPAQTRPRAPEMELWPEMVMVVVPPKRARALVVDLLLAVAVLAAHASLLRLRRAPRRTRPRRARSCTGATG